MSDHPPVERLVDLVFGLLEDMEASGIEAHLGACVLCGSIADCLTKERDVVTEALSVPLPSGLAGRILDGASPKSALVAPRQARRWTASRWQVAAAILVFAAIAVFISRTALPSGMKAEVRSGQVLVDGVRVARIPPGARTRVAGDREATIVMGLGSGVGLSQGSEATFTLPTIVLERGGGKFWVSKGDGPFSLSTPAGTLTVLGGEFTVELRPAENKGGQPMEHLLAMIVAVLSGDVQADVAGKSYTLGAGQGGIFSTESVLLSPIQDDDDKEKKEKKKGKKKEGEKEDGGKEEGKKKEKKEKEDKNEKDDENNEKGKNEKGKNEKGKNEKDD